MFDLTNIANQTIDDDSPVPIRKILSDEDLTSINQKNSICGFTNPLNLAWFFSVTGSEYCHTYFWIAKDLAWTQSMLHYSVVFGILALAWSFLILFHSLRTMNLHELWHFISLFLWLFANFWWMLGEAHDYEFPNEEPIGIQHSDASSNVLQVALTWCLLYYCLILPLDIIPLSKPALKEYDDGILKPRFSCFKYFRHYENSHMLFWIAKDLAWNRMNLSLWVASLIPTVFIAADFVYISAVTQREDSVVDFVHFASTLIWVFGNSVWAFGNFFLNEYDEPLFLFTRSADSILTARWYSSWTLLISFLPIITMYTLWITLTITGKLPVIVKKEENHIIPNITYNNKYHLILPLDNCTVLIEDIEDPAESEKTHNFRSISCSNTQKNEFSSNNNTLSSKFPGFVHRINTSSKLHLLENGTPTVTPRHHDDINHINPNIM